MSTTVSSVTEKDLLQGNLWTIGDSTGTITAGGNILYGILTGDVSVTFMTRSYGTALTSLMVQLYENSFTGGSVISRVNSNNLNNLSPAPIILVKSPTGTPSGTAKATLVSISGGASITAADEPVAGWYILKPNTQYLVRISNTSAVDGGIDFKWAIKKS